MLEEDFLRLSAQEEKLQDVSAQLTKTSNSSNYDRKSGGV